MMKLLNRDYSWPLLTFFAGLAFVLAWISTGRVALGSELARLCFKGHNLKLAARRGAWYLRRGWIGFDVLSDDYFDPTEEMENAHLDFLERFVLARSSKTGHLTTAADRAFITARRLNNNTDSTARVDNIARFKHACDALLVCTDECSSVSQQSKQPRKGDFPIANAKETLADFITLFPLDTLNWFFISGTFLGLIREGGFLPHDYDIDLGVFEDEIDIPAAILKIANNDRFVLKKYDHHQSSLFRPNTQALNPDIPYILKLVHISGIHIDLFIHYRDTHTKPANYWHGSSLHCWNNSAFDLASYQFYEHQVSGPADADTYLTENYGDFPQALCHCQKLWYAGCSEVEKRANAERLFKKRRRGTDLVFR